ncbi:elongation factor Tu [Providencia manganoxydans]|uniref:elongation factor Tu n=1 Tax=Providencia manganoxydans TaxID=2923283 RepID=UPI0032DAEAB9
MKTIYLILISLFSSSVFSATESAIILGDDYRYILVNELKGARFTIPKTNDSLIQQVKQSFDKSNIIFVVNMADGPTQKLRESILVARQSGHNSAQIYFHGKHLPREILTDDDFKKLMALSIDEVNELLNLYEIEITGVYYDWKAPFDEKFMLKESITDKFSPEKESLMTKIHSHAYVFTKEEAGNDVTIDDGSVLDFACQDIIGSATVRTQTPIDRGGNYSHIVLELDKPTPIPLHTRCLGTLNNTLGMAFITILESEK